VTPGDRRWVFLCAIVAATALGVRAYNTFAFAPLSDFDGAGHVLHTWAWYEGHAPHPGSWSGYHPPLYFMLGALSWHVLPDAVPMHMALRGLSLLFGAAALALVFGALARALPVADAAVASLLVWCVPFVAISTSMTGNETLCALLVTLLLARSQRSIGELPGARLLRAAVATGALGGLALLVKPTACAALGAVGLDWIRRLRHTPRRMVLCVCLIGVTAGVVASPHYARLAAQSDTPFALVSAAETSPEMRETMADQPPGVRRISDYLHIPAATLLAPAYYEPGLERSVPGLLYASAWADGHDHFLDSSRPDVRAAQVALCCAGLLPTALLALGGLRVLRRPREHARWFAALVCAPLLLLAFAAYAWRFPTYAAVKPSYLLAAVLPGAYLLGLGLTAARGAMRAALRAALVVLSLGATLVMRWGWWL
jgi:hypothetical protein